MRKLPQLFDNNRRWASAIKQKDPDFFSRLCQQQAPEYLWIGCSDSRVPANEIVGMLPGSIFVHRNVANVVVHTDLNCLSVLQYAVDILQVKHIIVCGHYGCGGVQAALENRKLGLIDNWLRHVQDVCQKHQHHLEQVAEKNQHDRLCELNVIEQVVNVSQTTILQDAWQRQQNLSVHGWIYSLDSGLLQDLGLCVSSADELSEVYKAALKHRHAQ